MVCCLDALVRSSVLGTQLAVAVRFKLRVAADGVRYHVQNADSAAFLFGAVSRNATIDATDNADVEMVWVDDDRP